MKKVLLFTLCLFTLHVSTQACDGGCTMGGSYLGILPQFHKNFAGLRYSHSSYTITSTHTHLHDGMPMTHKDRIEESYQTTEFWGRYVPVKNVQVFAFVPYAFNEQRTSRGSTSYRGLGDITVLANYSVLTTPDSAAFQFKHTLQLGAGVKLPTGTHTQHAGEADYVTSLQPGTGSTDFLVNGIYTVRYGKIGLNNDFTYRFNSAHAEGYAFGDRLSASSNLFYWHNYDNTLTLLPSAGLYFEHANTDRFEGGHEAQSGSACFANLGLNVYVANIAVGGTLQLPLKTHHNLKSKGNKRAMVNLSYLF